MIMALSWGASDWLAGARWLLLPLLLRQLAVPSRQLRCREGDGIGVDRCVGVGVVVGRYASAAVGGLQREESIPPVEGYGAW